jgi:hypothetical protein
VAQSGRALSGADFSGSPFYLSFSFKAYQAYQVYQPAVPQAFLSGTLAGRLGRFGKVPKWEPSAF